MPNNSFVDSLGRIHQRQEEAMSTLFFLTWFRLSSEARDERTGTVGAIAKRKSTTCIEKKKRKRESFSESKTRMNRLIFSFVVLRVALVSFPHPSFRERL